MESNWLWDTKVSSAEAKKILKSPEDSRFLVYAALLFARNNNLKLVFEYIDPRLFCKYWAPIKKRMRLDSWNNPRIVFWQAIYERLFERYKKQGIKFRIEKNVTRDVLLETVGDKIRNARKNKGLSQKALAKKIGISQQFISRIEKGRENVSIVALKKIARILDLDVKIELI